MEVYPHMGHAPIMKYISPHGDTHTPTPIWGCTPIWWVYPHIEGLPPYGGIPPYRGIPPYGCVQYPDVGVCPNYGGIPICGGIPHIHGMHSHILGYPYIRQCSQHCMQHCFACSIALHAACLAHIFVATFVNLRIGRPRRTKSRSGFFIAMDVLLSLVCTICSHVPSQCLHVSYRVQFAPFGEHVGQKTSLPRLRLWLFVCLCVCDVLHSYLP